MKKIILSILVLALIVAAMWAYYTFIYVEKPEKAYLRTASAAMLGDEDAFLDGFTDQSRPLVAGLLALARGDDIRRSHRHPYYYLASENVESSETEGDHAWVRLRRQQDAGSRARYDVPLVRAGNTWKIDALQFTGKERKVDKAR